MTLFEYVSAAQAWLAVMLTGALTATTRTTGRIADIIRANNERADRIPAIIDAQSRHAIAMGEHAIARATAAQIEKGVFDQRPELLVELARIRTRAADALPSAPPAAGALPLPEYRDRRPATTRP